MINRYLESALLADLTRKMVFLAGPRQCGKTTLAKKLLADAGIDAGTQSTTSEVTNSRS